MIKSGKNTVISDLTLKKLLQCFTKKSKKQIKKEFRVEKDKVTSYMLNGKAMKIILIVVLINKILLYKMSYFPKPYNCKKIK